MCYFFMIKGANYWQCKNFEFSVFYSERKDRNPFIKIILYRQKKKKKQFNHCEDSVVFEICMSELKKKRNMKIFLSYFWDFKRFHDFVEGIYHVMMKMK